MSEPKRNPLRERVWRLIEAEDLNFDGRPDLDWLDRFVITLILLNVAAIVLGTDPNVAKVAGTPLFYFQWISVVYFTAEYGLRVWACTAEDETVRPIVDRVHYMTSGMGIVDLLAIVPFWIAAFYPGNTPHLLEGLTLCRLFWLLKLGRYSNTASRIGKIVRSKRGELAAAFSVVCVLIVLAAAGMWFFEKDIQPDKFGTIPLAMWWSVVTLTTIGYGDVFPVSVGGRVFASFVALAGIGMIALPAGILAGAFSAELTGAAVEKGVEEGIEEALEEICPTCGRPYERE